MNERIFKLALQAMDFHGAIDTDTELKLTNDEFEKFAELIVLECAGVCEQYRGTEWGKAAECIGDSIRDHFGVEE